MVAARAEKWPDLLQPIDDSLSAWSRRTAGPWP